MQRVCSTLFLLATVLLATAAAADTRTFVIDNSSDGYGVDQCLATGARCGTLIANAYCQSQAYERAASFRRLEAGELTGTLPVAQTAAAVQRVPSSTLIAIECTR